ncbi:MAG: agmatinase family protein [Planctomycetota bacterium]|nr:agmatinase family protein [Planctomycetota bacterium]
MTTPFDPDAAATPGSGLFGLTCTPDQSTIQVLAVPFDATTSYRPGTRLGPEAVLAASHQIDLFDRVFGKPYEAGITLVEDPRFTAWNNEARVLAEPIIERGGHIDGDATAQARLERVNQIGQQVREAVATFADDCLAQGRIPAVLGGDHSVPQGAIEACARAHPGMGILHIDAHADLRVAFEGFQYSHASILHNVMEQAPGVSHLLQIGLRDLGAQESARIDQDDRIHAIFDDDWAEIRLAGTALRSMVRDAIQKLPASVYITLDVDGLDPSLCPNTGTPVPGGLVWSEVMLILTELARSGRRVVGFDLCEVSPGPEGDPDGTGWDAVVGARLLYKLCGCALHHHPGR